MKKYEIFDKFFTGINYWGSENAINMWENFHPASIEKDLELLRSVGITHLRVFPLWPVFQPLNAIYGPNNVYEYAFGENPLPDTPAGRAGVSEEACQKFEIFCDIAKKYGMKLIVALITGHMSYRTYNPPAFDGKALLSDPTVLKWQRRFVKYFVNRFKNQEVIAGWDLGNEPDNMPGETENPDAFYIWCSIISDSIKSCDDSRPVVSGVADCEIESGYPNLKSIAETCDINTIHPYNIFQTASDPLPTMKPILDLSARCRISEDVGNIPTFVQEFGSIGYMNCSYKTEADFYRCCLLTTLAHGCRGTMWWCAFDQGHHEFAPYRWNNIGSNYGFFDKDLNPKPVAIENLEFKKRLSAVPNEKLPPHTTNGTILIPRDDGDANTDILRATYILAKQANLDMDFSYALDPVPDSPLYILPSVSRFKSITKQRLDELMQKVKNGSVLYISTDTCLFRDFPEITGVNVAYREQVDAVKNVNLESAILPIKTTYFLKPESYKAQVLAKDENGEGVFFKHQYGKGYVYLLTLPLEKYLANNNGAFFKENQPPYDIIYRQIAKDANVCRIADSNHPFVRLTEHKIDENSRYVFAINYNNTQTDAKISFSDEYSVETIFGNEITKGILHLRENDGALFKLAKNL